MTPHERRYGSSNPAANRLVGSRVWVSASMVRWGVIGSGVLARACSGAFFESPGMERIGSPVDVSAARIGEEDRGPSEG